MSKYAQDPIAVVGMACRLPGNSSSPHALWEFLANGGIAENHVPETRFNLAGHYDGSGKPKTMRSPGGMFLENIDPRDFDAAFFGISKTDAIAMDPQQRQLLEVVYECFENAGITMQGVNNTAVGCFVGSYGVDYADMHARDPEDRPPSVTIGVGRAILSNRISHFFNLKGPSMTIDTACSGSLVGLDVACRYLQSKEINGAVVAGCNLYMSPEHNLDGGAMKGASSPSGKCHTFDVKADGYIKAEAVNALFIKRLSDAVRDGDPIRAVIRGTSTNSDGRTPGIASPSAEAQATAIRAAYANAGLTNFNDTGYLECHGTGTQAGDPQEVQGLSSVFSQSRVPEKPLIIGSIKSNVGHSEPAAGVSGMLKAILILEHGQIPGNPTFVTPNPKIDFEALKVKATRSLIPWPTDTLRRVSVNSFGYGGSNAHAVVEHPHVTLSNYSQPHKSSYSSVEDFFDDNVAASSKRPTVLLFSGNKESSLRSNLKILRQHLLNPNVKVDLSDLAYTLSERRTHHFNRAFLVASTLEVDESLATYGKLSNETPKIGLVFTGQGAQWPQMGKELVENFPEIRTLLQHFDDVLKRCSVPPSWSFLDELVEPRDPGAMRRPELSQPLVTAIQLAILKVLRKWGINSIDSVIGHSSGEIAAAYSAGLLTEEEAIIVAYYRGQAAKAFEDENSKVGMLAVGIGETDVKQYMDDLHDVVQIACYNSPSSVTLSGQKSALQIVKSRVSDAGHFARLLQVDLAYHSRFMADIATKYSELLSKDFTSAKTASKVKMFSTVFGNELEEPTGVDYWVSNLLCPVKFYPALQQMILSPEGPTLLIEIGPSGALAGPISQILKTGSSSAKKVQYYPVLKRGQGSVIPLYELAGRLFLSGVDVDFKKVNETTTGQIPSFIVDLPNYSWDHESKYWFENDSSKDWRNRLFPAHELLGSKILGTAWNAPSWKQTILLDHLPWLKDHKLGSDIVFPGAGFVALATAAVRQKHIALSLMEEAPPIKYPTYRIRDITFPKALVLNEDETGTKIVVALGWTSKAQDEWQEFRVCSLDGNNRVEHCRGLIRIEAERDEVTIPEDIAPLVHPVPGSLWYKAMNDIGYNFGPLFQKQLSVESFSGKRQSRSVVSLETLAEIAPNSTYTMHPISIDGCFQTCAPSLWHGNRSSVCDVLIPAVIGELVICTPQASSSTAISVTEAYYGKLGRVEETKNYISNASVYHPETGRLLFRVSGFKYHKLVTGNTAYSQHKYSCLTWKPDITQIDQGRLSNMMQDSLELAESDNIQQLLDFYYYKQPSLAVIELNNIPGNESTLWLLANKDDGHGRAACSHYAYGSVDALALVKVQEKYSGLENQDFAVVDIAKSVGPFSAEEPAFDLAIVRVPMSDFKAFDNILEKVRSLVRGGGAILFLVQKNASSTVDGLSKGLSNGLSKGLGSGYHKTHDLHTPPDSTDSNVQEVTSNDTSHHSSEAWTPVEHDRSSNSSVMKDDEHCIPKVGSMNGIDGHRLERDMLHMVIGASNYLEEISDHSNLDFGDKQNLLQFESTNYFGFLTAPSMAVDQPSVSFPSVTVYHFNALSPDNLKVIARLEDIGWSIVTTSDHATITTDYILILDELSTSLFPNLRELHWNSLKTLAALNKSILWVTTGAQMHVTNPDKAMMFGLARTIRAEDPSVQLTCLDIEDSTARQSLKAINDILWTLANPQNNAGKENEFVERNGIIYISRIEPDQLINNVWSSKENTPIIEVRDIHQSDTTIRLTCTRLGAIDSLGYSEIATEELPIKDNCVEVEIVAAGLNFKDVAVTMGIVPENEHLLGLEGAGTVRRLGRGVDSYKIGQRVLVFEKGTFSNRIQATTERVYPIPDTMTFEEASTLASVYLTALYSIYDLGHIQPGHRVLLHSASGGLGIACIQILQSVGAEIFCTVGTDDKRNFLHDNYDIPHDHIFHSRTTAFADEIMRLTNGYGLDLILNSLTGDLLDASWRCIAEGGNMVELGKRDMLDRNSLSMEPFGRNASYRCFDMAHKHVSDTLIARLLAKLFTLLEQGKVKPIYPIKTFPFEDIQNAFRYMRGANHIGKIVISREQKETSTVPVRPAVPKLTLRPDVSYLIIGGLRGLCGSLAIDLACHGARNLVVMARSGFDDPRSQGILKDIYSEGCEVDLIRGDVAVLEDVRRAFKTARLPIKGVIQGAMVLRDTIFTSMTIDEYTAAVRPKVQGTWNLHNIAMEQEDATLDFFTMLSSVSGVVGQKGQANYAAANAFLDSFSSYRHSLGLAACSLDLGAVDDVGYMSEHSDILVKLESEAWTPINESLFLDIIRCSILQQIATINQESSMQLITSIAIPQKRDSYLMADARFSTLCFGQMSSNSESSNNNSSNIRQFLSMISAGAVTADLASVINSGTEVLNAQFTTILRLGEQMEPAKALSSYGLDSLAAVEMRNWIRAQLNVEVTVLDITSASSLVALVGRIIGKLTATPAAPAMAA